MLNSWKSTGALCMLFVTIVSFKKTSLFGKNIIFKLARLLLKKPKDTKSISNKCHRVSNMTNKAIQRFTKIWSRNLAYKKHCTDWLNKFAFSHKWWLSKRINIKIQALEQVCALSVQTSVLSLHCKIDFSFLFAFNCSALVGSREKTLQWQLIVSATCSQT